MTTQHTKMNAVGFTRSKPITEPDSLIDFQADRPQPRPHDILVEVAAVSVNPVDKKLRLSAATDADLSQPTILGFDAVGKVVETGAQANLFKPGDRVYYAGDFTRPGTNAQFHTVDERIAAKAPQSLSDAQAAALPLTALTAWEALFDRMNIDPDQQGKSLLIIGGAGGVGSIATQLAHKLTKLKVIATASRPETEAFVKEMGAHHAANHRDLVASVKALGLDNVDYIFNAADTKGHWNAMAELIAPQGKICAIVEAVGGVDLSMLQAKSATFVWELMFTRPMFNTDDIQKQHEILAQVATLVDAGQIKSTLTQTLQGLSAQTLKQAHQIIESGKMLGKLAIQY